MFKKIKKEIEKQLPEFIAETNKQYSLNKTSPLLFKSIKDFVLRKGKLVRPILFVIGYLGFAKKPAANLYKSALSIELLHDFFLVHDDIIDKSNTRRGKPSMHAMLNSYLASCKNVKFNGQDLSIVAGDIMYAMAINAFLSIKEKHERKEAALKKFIEATIFTGAGEFIELLSGLKSIEVTTKHDIYKIYDLKTANYTFSAPLSIGAILSGANSNQIDKLSKFGIYLGRAFQIKDDILGMFAEEKKIGKSTLTDLNEAKKTILNWNAYNYSNRKNKRLIKEILRKKTVNRLDLLKMRKIVKDSGSLDYARKETFRLIKKAKTIATSSSMNAQYKKYLFSFAQKLLD